MANMSVACARRSARFGGTAAPAIGTIVNPLSANTRFTCQAAGSATLTLTIIDGPGCSNTTTVGVHCVP